MSFLHNSARGTWNLATSCFSAPAKYCQDNNIDWTTTGNLAAELALITVWGPLAAVREAALAKVTDSVARAIPAWVYGARDGVAHAVDLWQYGAGAGTATLAQRATTAGAKALDLGCGAVQAGYRMLCATAADFTLQLHATLDELEEKLQWTGIFDAVDDAVPSPSFSCAEDGGLLSDDDLQDWLSDDSSDRGYHGDGDGHDSDAAHTPFTAGPGLTASADDFAPACITGNSAAWPIC